jgi:hypothetical protein
MAEILPKNSKSQLSSAQKKLSTGKVKEGHWSISFAPANQGMRIRQSTPKPTNLKDRAAAGRKVTILIEAQTAFSLSNGGPCRSFTAKLPATGAVHSTNAASADAQWDKTCNKHKIWALHNVQPIRVNLPTRRVCVTAFTQVAADPGR